jgi:membrane protein
MIKWVDYLEDGLFVRSRSMGPPWGATLRIVRYPIALLRDWLRGEITVRAMSLAYTTLLSLVPLMVFSVAILKGLGARGDLYFILHEFFKPLGESSKQLTESVLQFVNNMRGDLLGSIGLAFLIYTIITTIQKVEGSFNFVWRVERPRSFARRFTEYLSVMVVGPILLAVSLGLIASAQHSPFAQRADSIALLHWAFTTLGQVVPYIIVTLVFTFMYVFVPNIKVQLKAAFIGGVTSGIIWALVGRAFTAFIVYSSHLVAVYTGFAIVLTTLIWVYVSWLILLIGAQLAFYVQFPQYLRHGQSPIELTSQDREQVAMSVMVLIGRDYHAGRNYWSADRLAQELDIPSVAMSPVLHSLEKAGLLVATENEQFLPGRDLDAILLSDILQAVRTLASGRLTVPIHPIGAAISVVAEIDTTIQSVLQKRTLKDLVSPA